MDQLEWFSKLKNEIDIDLYNIVKSKMIMEQYKKDHILVRKGEKGQKFYVILSGQVGVYTQNNDELILINICKEGQGIGELSIMSGKPRMATIICLTDCIFATLQATQYKKYLMKKDLQQIDKLLTQFECVTPFFNISRKTKIMVLLCTKQIEVTRSQLIYKSGQQAKKLFIILEGSIRLYTNSGKLSKDLCIIGENQLFGDDLNNEYYNETTFCESSKAILLMIGRNTLQNVLRANGASQVIDSIILNSKLKKLYRNRETKKQLKVDDIISQNEPIESTRTIYQNNGTYLSDKILIRANMQVFQNILHRNKVRRPIISVSVIERKPILDSGIRLRQLSTHS